MSTPANNGFRIEREIDLPATAAPRLVKELVGAGVDVHEVTAAERSLEDVFFEMTSTKELVS